MTPREAFVKIANLCTRHGAQPLGMQDLFEADLPGGRWVISRRRVRSVADQQPEPHDHVMTLTLSSGAKCSIGMTISSARDDIIYNWIDEPKGDDLVEMMMLL